LSGHGGAMTIKLEWYVWSPVWISRWEHKNG